VKRIGLGGVIGLALFIAVSLFRVSRFTSQQVSVERGSLVQAETIAAAERLSGAARIATISTEDPAKWPTRVFGSLHAYLADSFPNAHAVLRREIVGRDSLLFTWPGVDPSLRPIVLCAHLDVVPVEPGSETAWTHPPFSGRIAEGKVWGRGTLDDKVGVLGILEAVEILIARQFQPQRTVLLAFGADEEVGGAEGAAQIAGLLQERFGSAEFVLDEGGIISEGSIPGVAAPVALVGVAEKGFASVELAVDGEGGHSSMPPRHTAVGVVARAITRLEREPFPAELRGPTAELFNYVGPEMSFPLRLVFANRWIFGPLIVRTLASAPATDATVRTTTAATVVVGSPKDNLLPTQARAIVNFRIMPGDSVDEVLAHVVNVVDDPTVHVRLVGFTTEPSPVSSTDSASWHLIQRTIRQSFSDVIVAPYLTLGATDARYYAPPTHEIYRFAPIRLSRGELTLPHGTDERLPIVDYAKAVMFYAQLIRNATSL
jgi:carboxypeptidase PM20D1